MPDVALHFYNADVMASKAENILQNVQTQCTTCSIAPPIETAFQIHFGCALKHQSQLRISIQSSALDSVVIAYGKVLRLRRAATHALR